MVQQFPDAYQATESIRYQYRANHIYLLFSGLLNIGVGLHVVESSYGWRRVLRRLGSALLALAPVLLVWAFFAEPPQASPDRPLAFFGVVFSAIGIALRFFSVFHFGRTGSQPIGGGADAGAVT